jgi:16S rRNA (guanine527-N7)-methyltransferase
MAMPHWKTSPSIDELARRFNTKSVSAPSDPFLSAVDTLGITVSSAQHALLRQYLELLFRANAQFNLTAVGTIEEAWSRHVFDSVSLCPALADVPSGAHLLDVGSGGGLPGIPVAIMRPDLRVTLLEATGKKATFLEETVQTLGLPNVQVAHQRAEDYARSEMRERYQVVTARALSRLPVLLELTLPALELGGRLLAIKGRQADQEIAEAMRALTVLGGQVVSTTRTDTGTVIRIDKVAKTPARYPRRAGEPKRVPIL